LADIVAKRFFASRRATLIQKMNPSRKIDSSGAPVGFDSCALGGVADFCNKIGTKRTIQLRPRLSAFGPKRTKVDFGPQPFVR
jgi:hypothetical protein